MRTSSKPTGQVWRVLSEWSDNHELNPNQKQMAKMFGVSASLVSQWKFMEARMQPAEQILIHNKTGIPIEALAAAIALDEGNGMGDNVAARRTKRTSQAQSARAAQDGDAEVPPP